MEGILLLFLRVSSCSHTQVGLQRADGQAQRQRHLGGPAPPERPRGGGGEFLHHPQPGSSIRKWGGWWKKIVVGHPSKTLVVGQPPFA